MTADSTGRADSVPLAGPIPRGFHPGADLDWLGRYLPIKQHLTGLALSSLLQVGLQTRGLDSIVDVSFVGIDVHFDVPPPSRMYPFSYDGGRLPFRSGSFHTTVSIDTLGQVPPANRIDFLKELLRVSAARVVLAFAIDDGLARRHALLRALFAKNGAEPPAWLDPSDQNGAPPHGVPQHGVGPGFQQELPPAREVEAILDQLDAWSWRPLPTAGDLVSLLVGLAGAVPGSAPLVHTVIKDHAAELEAWILSGAFGPANRKVYLIERRCPRAPGVDLHNPATLINAITCPNCEGETDVVPPGVRCRGCGACFVPTGDGIFRLHRSPTVPRPGAIPGVVFTVNPNWSTTDWLMLVHNYLHAFPGDAPHQLWITVDPRQLSTTAALEMLRPLIGPFGDNPFAEIFLSDTPPAAGVAVPLSSEHARIFEYSSEWFRVEAASALRLHAAGATPGITTTGATPAATPGIKTYW